MNCLPDLREELMSAAWRLKDAAPDPVPIRASHSSGRSRPRWRASGRTLVVGLLMAVLMAAVALAATGVFSEGTALTPGAPVSAGAGEGVALPGTVRLLLSTADPGGGLPWGLRVERTTRGLTCVSIGRRDYGTIGVIGQDGAFSNDGRFHPVSRDYFTSLGCAVTDAHGHGFVNVALRELPASGLWGEARGDGGCSPAPSQPLRETTCPATDDRVAFFGLLGPDARSITYHLPDGGTRTTRLLAPYGAYLLVFREGSVPGNPSASGSSGGPGLTPGELVAVTYAGGRTCHIPRASLFESCPPVGFVPRHAKLPPASELMSSAHVRLRSAQRYCTKERLIVACDGAPPSGFAPRSAIGEPAQTLLHVSFRAPLAISSSRGFYELELRFERTPHCHSQGAGTATEYDIRRHQLVTFDLLIPRSCSGPVTGLVEYVPASGAATSTPVIGLAGQSTPIPVAKFGFRAP
jgi:hypothetical protein